MCTVDRHPFICACANILFYSVLAWFDDNFIGQVGLKPGVCLLFETEKACKVIRG